MSDGQVDLETYLGVLDREQLQALIVKCIIKDGTIFDELEEATQFLDHEQLLQNLEPMIDITNLPDLEVSIAPLRERFYGYMKLNLYTNALIVLYSYSNQCIMNIIEAGIDENDDKLKEFIIELEKDWKEIAQVYFLTETTKLELKHLEIERGKMLEKHAKAIKKEEKISKQKGEKSDRILSNDDGNMDEYIPRVDAPLTLMKIFEQLAQWREKCQVLGPIFGDALRVLKLRIIKETEDQKAAAKEAGAVKVVVDDGDKKGDVNGGKAGNSKAIAGGDKRKAGELGPKVAKKMKK